MQREQTQKKTGKHRREGKQRDKSNARRDREARKGKEGKIGARKGTEATQHGHMGNGRWVTARWMGSKGTTMKVSFVDVRR